MVDEDKPLRVFVSYSHDSEEHKDRALALAQNLRQFGIESVIDRYRENNPPASWPAWMHQEMRKSDFVLMVLTETYHRRLEDREVVGRGLGARWEGAIVTHDIYNMPALHESIKYLPLAFRQEDLAYVPYFLAGASHYVVDPETDEGLEKLLRRLKGLPEVVPAPLGNLRLPSSARTPEPSDSRRSQDPGKVESQTSKRDQADRSNVTDLMATLRKVVEAAKVGQDNSTVAARAEANGVSRRRQQQLEAAARRRDEARLQPHPLGEIQPSEGPYKDMLTNVDVAMALFDALAVAPYSTTASDKLILQLRKVVEASSRFLHRRLQAPVYVAVWDVFANHSQDLLSRPIVTSWNDNLATVDVRQQPSFAKAFAEGEGREEIPAPSGDPKSSTPFERLNISLARDVSDVDAENLGFLTIDYPQAAGNKPVLQVHPPYLADRLMLILSAFRRASDWDSSGPPWEPAE